MPLVHALCCLSIEIDQSTRNKRDFFFVFFLNGAQLSKVFKAAGRLRIRHSRRPDVVFVQEQVERAVGPEGAVGRLAVSTSAGSTGNGNTSGSAKGSGGSRSASSSSLSTHPNTDQNNHRDAQKLWESLCECRDALRAFVIATRDPLGGPPTLPPGECWALLEK